MLPLWHTILGHCPDRKEGRVFYSCLHPYSKHLKQYSKHLEHNTCSINSWSHDPLSEVPWWPSQDFSYSSGPHDSSKTAFGIPRVKSQDYVDVMGRPAMGGQQRSPTQAQPLAFRFWSHSNMMKLRKNTGLFRSGHPKVYKEWAKVGGRDLRVTAQMQRWVRKYEIARITTQDNHWITKEADWRNNTD